MKGAGIIIKKELYRVFGDKKMIFSLFILPAVLVIGIYGLMGVMVSAFEDDIEQHVSTVYIVNATDKFKAVVDESGFASNADITYLNESDYQSKSDSIRNDILEGNKDMVVYLDSELEAKIAAYSKQGDSIPTITVLYNSTENYSAAANSAFTAMVMSAYETKMLGERLGNLELLNVFNTQTELIQKEEKANSEFMSMMLPYLITMLLFAGAMSIGVDSIAGEKERGTLASMLLTPVKRSQIVTGKLVSLAILSGLSAIVYSVSMVIALPFMGDAMMGGAETSLSFTPVQILQLLAIMLLMVYLYVAVIALFAVIAKDTKEASSYISPIYIVVIVAGMLTMFTGGGETPIYKYAIPIYGNALAIKDLIVNELTLVNFGATLAGTAITAVVITMLITKAFNSERSMFNA